MARKRRVVIREAGAKGALRAIQNMNIAKALASVTNARRAKTTNFNRTFAKTFSSRNGG